MVHWTVVCPCHFPCFATLHRAGEHSQEAVSAGVKCSGLGSGQFTWCLGSVISELQDLRQVASQRSHSENGVTVPTSKG